MAKHASSTSAVVTLIVLGVIGVIFWKVSPIFLPRYRWTHVDFAAIAKNASAKGTPTTEERLRTEFDIEFGYYPRGKNKANDPRPWVLLKMSPAWHTFTGNDADTEEGVIKRCVFISDRTGQPLGEEQINAGQAKDRFFRGKAWRLPPGSLGLDSEHPIILVEMMEMQRMTIMEADVLSESLRNPKLWEAEDDGYDPNEDQ